MKKTKVSECCYSFKFPFGVIHIIIKKVGSNWRIAPCFDPSGLITDWKIDYVVDIPCSIRTPGKLEALVQPEFSKMLYDANKHGKEGPGAL